MPDLDRRALLTLLGVGVVELAAGCSRVPRAARTTAATWRGEIAAACREVRWGALTQAGWQDAVEQILAGSDLASLLADLDFDAVVSGLELPDVGVATRPLAQLEDVFPGRLCLAKIFGLQRGRAIIPHGHRHMASAHLVLSGELALRQFDKLSETDAHMVIRPTVEEAALRGSVSSISDERNNVHWFVATSARAYTLDLLVLDLAGGAYEIHNIDPLAGEALGNGLLRAPKLDVETALRKYGKTA